MLFRLPHSLRERFLFGLRLLGVFSRALRFMSDLRQVSFEFTLTTCEGFDPHRSIAECSVGRRRFACRSVVSLLGFSDGPFRVPSLSA